jgi:hypothetical protein
MCRVLTLLLFIMLPLAGAADDGFVYESFSGVKIGRVFLSQGQRESLDARRLLNPQEGDAGGEQPGDAKATSRNLPSAGFIIGRDGRSKIWKNGDFVDSSGGTRTMTFPGDVTITRHVQARKSDADVDPAATGDGRSDDEDR